MICAFSSSQGHAQGDCRGWEETYCALGMTFLPKAALLTANARGGKVQVTVVVYVVMCGNNRRNILASLKSQEVLPDFDGGQDFTLLQQKKINWDLYHTNTDSYVIVYKYGAGPLVLMELRQPLKPSQGNADFMHKNFLIDFKCVQTLKRSFLHTDEFGPHMAGLPSSAVVSSLSYTTAIYTAVLRLWVLRTEFNSDHAQPLTSCFLLLIIQK